MLYSVSQRHYFREISRIIPAGGTVYLDDAVAKKYIASVPGLLKPVRQTTQAAPGAVRSTAVKEPRVEEPADAAAAIPKDSIKEPPVEETLAEIPKKKSRKKP